MNEILAIAMAFDLPDPQPDIGPLLGMFTSVIGLIKGLGILFGVVAFIFAVISWLINFRQGHNPAEAFSTLIWVMLGIALILFAVPLITTLFSGSWN